MLMYQDKTMTVNHNRYAGRWEVRYFKRNGTLCLVHVWDDNVAVVQSDVKDEDRLHVEEYGLQIVRAIKERMQAQATLQA